MFLLLILVRKLKIYFRVSVMQCTLSKPDFVTIAVKIVINASGISRKNSILLI